MEELANKTVLDDEPTSRDVSLAWFELFEQTGNLNVAIAVIEATRLAQEGFISDDFIKMFCSGKQNEVPFAEFSGDMEENLGLE